MATFEETLDLAVELAVKKAVATAVPDAVSQLKVTVRNEFFPVGAVYLSISNDNPADIFGGTWVKKGQGRCLWGSDGSNVADSTIAAGLPNITGKFSDYDGCGSTLRGASGAFAFAGNYDSETKSAGSDDWGKWINFDASRSNSIYGRSSTVQPPAYVVNIWVRTA